MEDIIKSGILGLVLLGSLIFASVNEERFNNENKEIKIEKLSLEDENSLNNKDFHTPQ